MKNLQKLLLFTLTISLLGLLLYPMLMPKPADASAKRWPNGYREFSPKTEKLFKLASYYFYKQRGELGNVPCQPQDVRIVYGDYGTYEDAHVKHIGDAFQYKDNKNNGYCNVYFNVRYINPRAENCIIFMHEYGHLLGHVHNNDIHSPMYQGYAEARNAKYKDILYYSYHRNLEAKSVCNAPKIFQEPFPPSITFH